MLLNTSSARLNYSTLGRLGDNLFIRLVATTQCVAQTSAATIRLRVAVLHSTTSCSASGVASLSVFRNLSHTLTAQADTSGAVLRQAVPNGLLPINFRPQVTADSYLRIKVPLATACNCAMESSVSISNFARVRIPIAGTASSISHAFLRRQFNIAINGSASVYSTARLRHKVSVAPDGEMQCRVVCTAKLNKTNYDYAPQGRAFVVDGSPRVYIVRMD